jgi:hypothetical protein
VPLLKDMPLHKPPLLNDWVSLYNLHFFANFFRILILPLTATLLLLVRGWIHVREELTWVSFCLVELCTSINIIQTYGTEYEYRLVYMNNHNIICNNQTGNHILSNRFRVLLPYSKSVLSTGAKKCRGPNNSTFNNFVNRCNMFCSRGPS